MGAGGTSFRPSWTTHPALRTRSSRRSTALFETYTRAHRADARAPAAEVSADADTSEGVWTRTLRAKALDTVRGLLPAATKSNVGLYGTGQAYEALLLRMRAHPLAEVRACADQILRELRR